MEVPSCANGEASNPLAVQPSNYNSLIGFLCLNQEYLGVLWKQFLPQGIVIVPLWPG
jgi:hypothetical protein